LSLFAVPLLISGAPKYACVGTPSTVLELQNSDVLRLKPRNTSGNDRVVGSIKLVSSSTLGSRHPIRLPVVTLRRHISSALSQIFGASATLSGVRCQTRPVSRSSTAAPPEGEFGSTQFDNMMKRCAAGIC